MFFQNILSALPLLSLASAAALPERSTNSSSLYDTIIVGGGPSGLAALSGLARMRRNVLLIDSGEYRNSATRHMHDVIGLDGVTPAYYRYIARKQLEDYDTVSMTNGTVKWIENTNTTEAPFTVYATFSDGSEPVLTARKIVLGTGLIDDIPTTPGLQENWGKGIYWCPWCDGHEHADQPLGLLSPMTDVPELVREVSTLNKDVVAFVNGTDTPENRNATEASFTDFELYLSLNNVTVYNQTILNITRLQDGAVNASEADPSLPSVAEYDLFRIYLDDGTSVDRAALFTSFADEQRSSLGAELGVNVSTGRMYADNSKGLSTNVFGVYAIGDANTDAITNVPHATFTGKRAAVYIHVQLAREEVAAQLAAAKASGSSYTTLKEKREIPDERAVWDEINLDERDIFYAGDFDQ